MSSSGNQEWSEMLAVGLSVARIAGETLRTHFYSSINPSKKNDNGADLVTQTDTLVEKIIFSQLREAFPNHCFLGEESTTTGDAITEAPTWVVDPIDGTTNFVHGVPSVCISIALVVDYTPVVGVVFNPITNEMYYAMHGSGAFYINPQLPSNDAASNVHRLPLRGGALPLGPLSNMLVVTEYGSDLRKKTVDAKTKILNRIIVEGPVRGVRGWGTAALDMCHVARGAGDAYWEAGLHIWDFAAAVVIVREAGGVVLNWKPSGVGIREEKLDLTARNVLAVRGAQGGDKEIQKVVDTLRTFLDLDSIELL